MPPRKTTTKPNDDRGAIAAPRRSARVAASTPTTTTVLGDGHAAELGKRGGETRAREGVKVKKRKISDASVDAAKHTDADEDEDENENEKEKKLPNPVLKIGDALPSITLHNEKGEAVNVAELAAERGVVLFLVPRADTPGCTTQACGFRDAYPDFSEHEFDVYCLSADTPAAQSKWQSKKSLPYPLLSDPERKLIGALGAGEGGKTVRSHFVFAREGKLVESKIPVKPADSPRLALEFIQGLRATG